MQAVDTYNPGAYRPGESLLHRFDPRLKLLLLFGVMVCVFSAVSPLRLLLLALVWFVGVRSCKGVISDSLVLLRIMRWLLFFTLLLHLCFTPGRTMFGTSWLSYDGLLRGLLVDGQLLLAILFSLLLAWTTRPVDLVWGMARLLSPFQRLKLPVQEAGGLLLMVLHFFPLIQQEVSQLKKERGSVAAGWLNRLNALIALLGPLVFRLIDRADQLSKEIVVDRDRLVLDECALDGSFSREDLTLFFLGALLLILFGMI